MKESTKKDLRVCIYMRTGNSKNTQEEIERESLWGSNNNLVLPKYAKNVGDGE